MHIVILHDEVRDDATKDELDTLVQAEMVKKHLLSLGHTVSKASFSLNFHASLQKIRSQNADLVFNLVESLAGRGDLIHVAPTFLDIAKIRFTGCSSTAIFSTSNKLEAKRILSEFAIPTPAWHTAESLPHGDHSAQQKFIVKSVWEHASIGLNDNSVVENANEARRLLEEKNKNSLFFAEGFIEGREFNVGILQGPRGPIVLPMAEIVFKNFPKDKPQIVGYDAKWNENSFEYQNTVREFCTGVSDEPLRNNLAELSLRCWKAFELSGYARVDFRVDCNGVPYVLEVNANPCISPDSGFVAAAARAGISERDVTEFIVAAAFA
jgi:D-alanine-D-alanine ligase